MPAKESITLDERACWEIEIGPLNEIGWCIFRSKLAPSTPRRCRCRLYGDEQALDDKGEFLRLPECLADGDTIIIRREL